MSHNQQLDGLLVQVKETAESARKEEDFKSIFPMLRNFQQTVGPIKYDNSAKWYAAWAVATLGAMFAIFYFVNLEFQQYLGDAGYVVLGVFVAGLIGILVAIGTANSGLDSISDTIFRADVYFDNKLSGVNIEGKKSDLYHQLREEFGDFRSRGDEDRYIERVVRGEYAGKEYSFEYDYYVFHYVEVWYEPVNHYDSKGKYTHTTMEKRTRTCYRRGLLLDFPFIKGLAVVSDGGAYSYPNEYSPTSEEFKFSVDADSEHEAAKFLKPAVVLAFVELDKYFSGLNIEVNRAGRMNIAFSDSNVLALDRKFSIAQPDEFEKEIRSHLDLPKLRLLLQFIETLKKYNDSNF